ncbi:MAG: LeuA family protein [Anaerolineae bacterium]
MVEFSEEALIYDWNVKGEVPSYPKGVEFDDETLRDGLQSPSVTHPSIEEKIRLVHLMDDLGIDTADIGYAAAGPKILEEVIILAKDMADNRLRITPNCAARTVEADITPIIEASQKAGIAIEACAFIGSSPIRRYAEAWDLDNMLRLTEESVKLILDHDLPMMYVTEDTTRADPETLRKLYTTAIEAGARRICLSDTVGHATPEGAYNLVTFIKGVVADTGEDVKIDWHGHRDRGLSIPNTLAAIAAGANRVHGAALGIGERCGNTPMDLLLVNLRLLGVIDNDLSKLPDYCRLASEACHVPIPFNYPVVGADAFRTAAGVHASAVLKAVERGDVWLANRVYSGVPADMFGLEQGIEVGPLSGAANVRFYLNKCGVEPTVELVEKILAKAKESRRSLTEEEIMAFAAQMNRGK